MEDSELTARLDRIQGEHLAHSTVLRTLLRASPDTLLLLKRYREQLLTQALFSSLPEGTRLALDAELALLTAPAKT